MTFLEASLIAPDPTQTVSGWVVTPGDTVAKHRHFALEGKRVAALSHYQTKLHNAPRSLHNDGSAAR